MFLCGGLASDLQCKSYSYVVAQLAIYILNLHCKSLAEPPHENNFDISMLTTNTQVNRMSKSRRLLATGGKQRSFGLHMVCFEIVLYHNEPH